MIRSRPILHEPAEFRPLSIFTMDGVYQIETRARHVSALPDRMRSAAVAALMDHYRRQLRADLLLSQREHAQAIDAIERLVMRHAGISQP